MCALAITQSPLAAQRLRVQALDSATNAPLAYVLLDIRDENGVLAQSAMTNDNGMGTVQLPRAGNYRIMVRRVGFRAQTVGPVRVAAGETLPVTLRVPRVPAALPTVRVSEKEQCDITARTDDEASRIVTLWEQMQTAFKLNELAQTDSVQSLRAVKVTGYVAHSTANKPIIIRHTVKPSRDREAFAFSSYTSDDISRNGYVRYTDRTATYIAPIEHVLLVNAFVTEHCFRLVAAEKTDSALVGLAFTPTKSRTVPEIAGTLWADATTGTPRHLDFWFIDNRIPRDARGPGKTGGEVYFGQLANETWATVGWLLRMPTTLAQLWNGERLVLTEAGGIAVPIDEDSVATRVPGSTAFATFAAKFQNGGIAAQVIDGDTKKPLRNATVTMRQYVDSSATSFETDDDSGGLARHSTRDTTVLSNSDGRIMVEGLPPGVYDVRFTAAERDRSPVQAASIDVVVKPGSVNSLQLITADSEVQLGRCSRYPQKAGIYGTVRIGEGPVEPFASFTSARVTASWLTPDGKKQERTTHSNNKGSYQLCDLPKNVPVTLLAVLETQMTARTGADPNAPRVEMEVELGEWQVAYMPFLIPPRSNRR